MKSYYDLIKLKFLGIHFPFPFKQEHINYNDDESDQKSESDRMSRRSGTTISQSGVSEDLNNIDLSSINPKNIPLSSKLYILI